MQSPADGTEALVSDCPDGALDCPRYDTDWSATGPLIERLRIDIVNHETFWTAVKGGADGGPHRKRDGDTALLAVCNLLLAHPEITK